MAPERLRNMSTGLWRRGRICTLHVATTASCRRKTRTRVPGSARGARSAARRKRAHAAAESTPSCQEQVRIRVTTQRHPVYVVHPVLQDTAKRPQSKASPLPWSLPRHRARCKTACRVRKRPQDPPPPVGHKTGPQDDMTTHTQTHPLQLQLGWLEIWQSRRRHQSGPLCSKTSRPPKSSEPSRESMEKAPNPCVSGSTEPKQPEEPNGLLETEASYADADAPPPPPP